MKCSREEKQEMIDHCRYNLEKPTPKRKMFERLLVVVMEVKTHD